MSEDVLHILVVGGEADRLAVGDLLRGDGAVKAEVVEAGSGAAAVAAAREGVVDCVLLDCRTADGGGAGVLRDLRAAGVTAPVIVLAEQGDDRMGMTEAGAGDVLVKSRLVDGEMARAVRAAVRVHRAERAAAAARDRAAELEQRFRAMADSAPMLLWVSEPGAAAAGRTYFNQAWLAFRGQTTRDEADGRWLEGVHPEDRTRVAGAYATAAGAHASVEVEYRLRRADGAYRWLFERATPRCLADGATAGYVGSCIDVTDRREAEARVRESNAALSAVIASSPLPIYAVAADGSVTLWNPAAERAFGWSAGEVIGKYVPLVPHGPDDGFDRVCGRALAGEAFSNAEVVRHRKDGSAMDLSVSAAPLRDHDGRITGVIVVADDITMRKAVEMERARLLRRERRARAEADAGRRRLAFLAEASAALSASLDYEATLNAMARVCVPAMGDWCAVHMLDEGGEGGGAGGAGGGLRQIAVAHCDPERIGAAIELAKKYPVRADEATGVAEVARTGRPQLYEEVSDRALGELARDGEHLRLLRAVGMRSAMIVPLAARGRTLGTILFVIADDGRTYTKADLELVADLARRAGIAVDNAGLYRQAQRALGDAEQSAALIDTLFRSSPTGLTFLDTGLRFRRVNSALAAVTGLPAEAHLGRHLSEVVPAVWPTVRPYLEAVLSTGQPVVDVEAHGATAAQPGVTRHWLTSWYPVRTTSGQLLGVGAVMTEITERKQYEAELKEAKEAAERSAARAERSAADAEAANAAKDQFLAVLSHELRTPLTPVLVAAQSMEEDRGVPAALRPLVEMIHRNVELEARLIDDLLDLTRIAKGKLELSPADVDAHACLRSAIEICEPDTEAKRIAVEVDLSAGRHWVRADPARLQQVFWNLIKNAVKFTPNGGLLTVATSSEPAPGGRGPAALAVRVTDTGIGIDAEVLPRIFDAFEQGEKSVTRRFGGLGLGLAITRALVDMHHGTIRAESEGKGQGATFVVALPTVAEPVASGPAPEAAPAGGSARAEPGVRILMVDDHEDTSRAMKVLLERRGYSVRLANSVTSALEEAGRDDGFDLLISDIGLPDGTGIDLMRELRERHRGGSPLMGIALSGFGMEEDVRRSKEAGFAEHLTKPVDLKRLHAVIRELTAVKTAKGR